MLRDQLPADAERLIALIRPTIRITARKARAADRKPGASRLGGSPELAPGAPWPRGRYDALDFVAQIELGQLVPFATARELPRAGVLSFFCSWNQDGEWDHA